MLTKNWFGLVAVWCWVRLQCGAGSVKVRLQCGAGSVKVRWKCGVLSMAVRREYSLVWFECYAVCFSAAVQYGSVKCGVVHCTCVIVLVHSSNVTNSSRNACFWQQCGAVHRSMVHCGLVH